MDTVIYDKKDRIATITLNRPEAKNAVSPKMQEELSEVWKDFVSDDGMELAIITGAGDAFCAGTDLKESAPLMVKHNLADVRNRMADGIGGGITRGLHRQTKPIIAAVNGWALAGGLEISLAADIRIASERAMFGSFETRRGFHHGDGGIPRLINSCGVSFAMEMLLTAEPVDAHRAMQVGLVSRVVPHEKLMETTLLVARQILRNEQFAVRSAKQTILDMIGRPLDDQLRNELIAGYTCMTRPAEVNPRLDAFYKKTDAGRAGENKTNL